MAGLVAYLAILAALLAIFTSAHPTILVKIYHTPGAIGRSAHGLHEWPPCSWHQAFGDREAVLSIDATRHHDETDGLANLSFGSTLHPEQSLLTPSSVHVTEMLERGVTRLLGSLRRERRDLASDGHQDSRNGNCGFNISMSSGTSEEANTTSWSQLSGMEKLLVGGGLIIWSGTGLGVFLKRMVD